MTIFWVALGGALGAVARFWTHTQVLGIFNKHFDKPWPAGTLTVNVVGSFLIGIAYVLLVERDLGNAYTKALFMTGFLGAFTTFSTFSLDTLLLLQQARWAAAISYAGISLLACLGATGLAMALTKALH